MNQRKLIHGIDPYAPGGIDALLAHHRLTFGDAVMSANAGGEGGGAGGDGGSGQQQSQADGENDGTGGQQAPAGTTPPAGEQAPTTEPNANEGDLWDDPAKAKAEIERLRAENGRDRTAGKDAAAKQATDELTQRLGKALGLIKDDETPDPDKLTQQLTEREAQAKQAQTELAVYKLAGKNGADADALLDSRAFLAKLADKDPNDVDAVTAAIKAAITENPKLKSTQAAGKSGAEFNGGSGEGTTNNGKPIPLHQAVSGHYGI